MHFQQKLDVDILVANYNNAEYLPRFFRSFQESSAIPNKLIIVDDGSIDNSVEIIKAYSTQLKYVYPIYLEQNKGFANALNEGIKYLVSTYTLRIDPDDYLFADRIQKQYDYIRTNNLDVVGSNIQYFDSDSGRIVFKSHVEENSDRILEIFKSGACGIIHGSSIIRTIWLKKYGYQQNNVPAEDYELFSRILLSGGQCENMPDYLTAVRVHMHSVSNFLPFSTIQKTYSLTESLWGIKHSKWHIKKKYYHLKYYRKFLFEKQGIKRLFYLLISVISAPQKVIKRIFA